jgi:hypothetical protein
MNIQFIFFLPLQAKTLFKNTTMKKLLLYMSAAALLASCGGADDPTIDEPIVEPIETQDTIHWQLQNTLVVPLIKSIVNYLNDAPRVRYVTTYKYVDGKILEFKQVYQTNVDANIDANKWKESGYYGRLKSYTYSHDTVICVENGYSGNPKLTWELYNTSYYYIDKTKGVATRCTIVPENRYSRKGDFDFEYNESRNITLFNWEMGNTMSTTEQGEYLFNYYVDSAQYDMTYKNPHYFLNDEIFLGRASENLPVKENLDAYTYEFNDRGLVVKKTIISGSDTSAIYYEYY